eukprot:1161785-Pelagomonas_calceolata.AAC.19
MGNFPRTVQWGVEWEHCSVSSHESNVCPSALSQGSMPKDSTPGLDKLIGLNWSGWANVAGQQQKQFFEHRVAGKDPNWHVINTLQQGARKTSLFLNNREN